MPNPASPVESRDAGQTPADAPARRSRLRRPRAHDLVATALFALAGVMFVAGATTSGGGDLRVDQTGGLQEAISSRTTENLELRSRVTALSEQVEALRERVGQGPAIAETTRQIAELSPMAGLTPVVGPGVTVSLDDARPPNPIPDGMTGDDFIVHQQDVQGVVNALWRGGASGVTVMGQRLASTSAVRCVGNTVILHGRVYSPPFVIAGVGDVAALEQALEEDDAVSFFRDWAARVGMGYSQVSSARLELPPFTGPVTPQYASVVS